MDVASKNSFAACTISIADAVKFAMANTEKLIELIKKYPILYDLSHEEYKNVRKKDKAWDEIGEELKENGKLFFFNKFIALV